MSDIALYILYKVNIIMFDALIGKFIPCIPDILYDACSPTYRELMQTRKSIPDELEQDLDKRNAINLSIVQHNERAYEYYKNKCKSLFMCSIGSLTGTIIGILFCIWYYGSFSWFGVVVCTLISLQVILKTMACQHMSRFSYCYPLSISNNVNQKGSNHVRIRKADDNTFMAASTAAALSSANDDNTSVSTTTSTNSTVSDNLISNSD